MTAPLPASDHSPNGRFLGRPKAAYPGYVPPAAGARTGGRVPDRARDRSRAGPLWLAQALTGAFLLVFLGIHLVAQHLLVPEGLRDHAHVIAYLREPVALAAELGLLASVIAHACLGMRASLVDVVGETTLRRASVVIALVGAAAFVYGLWLTVAVISAATG
jgi:succinate dehydrogenase hydrophobic anchor subunit